jgi:hydrogenase maturation protease
LSTLERDRPAVGLQDVEAPRRDALIVGVGNPYRGDDAAGLLVARRLREACPAGVRVVETRGETAELLDVWEGAELVVLIDAVVADAPPGTIYRFAVGADPVPPVFARRSTHTLGVGEAIGLAAALDRLPPCLIVYGIAGRRFELGESHSPPVEAAVAAVTSRVLADVASVGPESEAGGGLSRQGLGAEAPADA